MKTKLLVAAASTALIFPASAALMQIENLFVPDSSSTLYANNDNSLMTSGIVTIGYFPSGINPTDMTSLLANIASFTVIDSQAAGDHWLFSPPMSPVYTQVPGYAGNMTAQQVPGGLVTGGSPLLGRNIYSIVSNAASLGVAAAGDQFALVSLGVFLDDDPSENTYLSNPTGGTAIIGSFDTTVVEGETFDTLKMDVSAVPEPSALVLTLFFSAALCSRRKR